MADGIGIVAAGWGVLMAISPLLQMRRMLDRHSSADLSLGYFGVLMVGFVLWIAYGIAIGSVVLVIPNTTALVVSIATVLLAHPAALVLGGPLTPGRLDRPPRGDVAAGQAGGSSSPCRSPEPWNSTSVSRRPPGPIWRLPTVT